MPRMTPITQREQVAPGGEEAFDRVIASRGRINAPQSMLMYVPEVSALATGISDALRFGSTMSDADVELGIIVAAREFDIAYVWSSHAKSAADLGVAPALIEAIATGGALPVDTGRREAMIVRFGRQLIGRHAMDDALFAEVRAELGDRGVIELAALMGYYVMIGCALIATDYPVAPGAPVLPARGERGG
jgi:4-carboxymuconolactone decarboxylase